MGVTQSWKRSSSQTKFEAVVLVACLLHIMLNRYVKYLFFYIILIF